MTEDRDITLKNLELSAEFSRYLFEHPEFEEQLPDGAEVVLLPEFDHSLRMHNEQMGREMEAEGEKVAYVRLGNLRPKTLSRLDSVVLAG